MHQNTDFCDYVFVGKTSIVLKDLPLSHWRLKSKYPNGVQIPLKYREKVNIWGGLSTKGLTRFFVSLKCGKFFLLPVLNRALVK
jgi:hypothetical protein